MTVWFIFELSVQNIHINYQVVHLIRLLLKPVPSNQWFKDFKVKIDKVRHKETDIASWLCLCTHHYFDSVDFPKVL